MRTDRIFASLFAMLLMLGSPTVNAQDTSVTVTEATSFADHWSVGVGAETDLIGLAFGARPEVLFRPWADRGFNLRLASGFLAGPEITFVPIDLGVRQLMRPGRSVRPHIGAGFEYQVFWYGGEDPATRPALYFETGFEAKIADDLWLGLQFAPDLAVFGSFGFGFATRVTLRYDL